MGFLCSFTGPRQVRDESPVTRHPSPVTSMKALLVALALATLSGCGSAPKRDAGSDVSAEPARAQRGGGYYLDDGPGATPPADLDSIPEPVPRLEPLRPANMRPYVVMGQSYKPIAELQPYRARGIATWYGRRYHGKPTSSGEIYDMYGISAAHPTLPIPSYARVTNLANGRSVVVRINDRGPFIDNRLIDLSYTAAHRIGLLASGSALVEVEAIIPDGSPPATAVAVLSPPPAGMPAGAASASPAGRYADEPPPRAAVADADPILAVIAAASEPLPARAAPPIQPIGTHERAAADAIPAAGGANDTGFLAAADAVFLQLAAFGSRENAERYLARARTRLEWLAGRLHLVSIGGLYRVHVGPYGSASDARREAERLGAELGSEPLIVRR
jgi:rare lipoprotein A